MKMESTERQSLHEAALLREFKITKEVRIKIWKLDLFSNTTKEVNKGQLKKALPSGIKKPKYLNHTKQKVVNTNKLLKCQLCEFSAPTLSIINQHLKSHSARKKFKCLECKYESDFSSNLLRHVNSWHNSNTVYPCKFCAKSFSKKIDFQQYTTLTHIGEKAYACQYCRKTFTWNFSKNKHQLLCKENPKQWDAEWVESIKQFQCGICKVKMFSKLNLTNHARIHTLERPYKCEQCDYAGCSSQSVTQHTKRHHDPNRIKSVLCQLCPKNFFTKSQLNVHIFSHTKETPFKCHFCKRQFSVHSYRHEHEQTCKSNPMHNHKKWVEEQKKFKCDICNYSCRKRSRLARHSQIHITEKKLKCELCNFMCSEQFSLRNHVWIHTDEKPFKCPYCPFRTAHTSSMSKHKKKHCPSALKTK